jgi:type I restriction enzyme M protein
MREQNILKYESKIWSVADDLLSNGFKKSSWSDYMMPFFSLMMYEGRILNKKDEILKDTIKRKEIEKNLKEENPNISKQELEKRVKEEIKEEIKEELEGIGYNHIIIEEEKTLKKICENDTNFLIDFENYLNAFDNNTKILLGIISQEGEKFLNLKQIKEELQAKGINLLYNYTKKWSEIDLRGFNNSEITTLEEHIKKKWADISAATSGEQYTPPDIIELITDLAIAIISKYNKDINWKKYLKIYDPTCGGGNMLFGVEDNLKKIMKEKFNKEILVQTNGQEINSQLYALSKIESLFRDESRIELGNTLTKDKFIDDMFHIIVSNVPFGTDWKTDKKYIETDKSGRFKHLPSTSDGQLLFLQHILSKTSNSTDIILDSANKVLQKNGLGISINVTNGSPLFSGDAGSGESNIRKEFLDNDNILAIIQLPKDEFFNTGITTYLWVMTQNKIDEERFNKVQLIDASTELFYEKMTKSLGNKRNRIHKDGREKIVQAYMDFNKCKEDYNKIFDKEFFYYNKQKIVLHNKDINGKSIRDLLEKNKKSIILKNVKIIKNNNQDIITLNLDGTINNLNNIEEIENETLKEKNKRIQKLITNSENIEVILNDDVSYTYENEKESIIKKDKNGNIEELGNGVIKVSSSYKKETKTQKEGILIKVELTPKFENDVEVIPFQEIKKGKIIKNDIDDFLSKWVEKDFEKLDNTVGVEINFNKIFYKYQKLRSIQEIVEDLNKLAEEESKLDKDIFNFSPIDMTKLSIEE